MKATIRLFVLGAAFAGVCLADVFQFEGYVSTEDKKNVQDVVQARNAAEARKIFQARYPGGSVLNLHRMAGSARHLWFRASINTADGVNTFDTCRAHRSGDARRIFKSRHPGARFGSVVNLGEGKGYSLFEARVKTGSGRSVTDIGLAKSQSDARKMFLSRYTGGKVTRLTKVKTPRPKTPK